MIPASVVSKLYRIGLTDEQLEQIVDLIEEATSAVENKAATALEARRAHDRERKQRQRSGTMSRDVTGLPGTIGTSGTDDPGPQTPNENIKTNTALAREGRIDPDWEPSPADVEAVTERGLPPDRLAAEVQAFREHHLGAGTLSDGFGMLFRGWVRHGQRNAKPTRSRPKPSPVARGSPSSNDGPRVDTPFAGRLAVSFLVAEAEAGRWRPGYGPPPGQPRCPIAAYLPAPPASENAA